MSRTMTLKRSRIVAVIAVFLAICTPAYSDKGIINPGEETANPGEGIENQTEGPFFMASLDLDALSESQFGKQIIDMVLNRVAKEIEKDPEDVMATLCKSLGFDPFEQEIKLFINGYIYPNDLGPKGKTSPVLLMMELKNTTGNLEGLLLTVPGYRSEKHGEHTIHSANPQGEFFTRIHMSRKERHIQPPSKKRLHEFFAAFCTSAGDQKQIFISNWREQLVRVLDSLDRSEDVAKFKREIPAGQIATVWFPIASSPVAAAIQGLPNLSNLPSDSSFGEVVNGMLKENVLSIEEQDGDLLITITLIAKEEEKALQLEQLVKASMGLVDLYKDDISDGLSTGTSDSIVLSVLDNLAIERAGAGVKIRSKVSTDEIIRLVKRGLQN